MEDHIKRMLIEFLEEIREDHWFGKERELVSRFAFSKLVKNVGCSPLFYDTCQIGIEVRVCQVEKQERHKREVCKDMIIWKRPNQTVWDNDPVPICVLEWKHRNKKAYNDDIDWLKAFTKSNEGCFGVALNIENEGRYTLHAVLIKNGDIMDDKWINIL